LYVSFNRTAIFGTALLVGLYLLSWSGTRIRRLLLVAVLASLAGGLAVFFIDAILDQFMRGAGELTHSELSRLYFWQRSFDMIVTNPFFGNGSLTFRIDDPVTGLPQHAHNSMLVLLATHGLVPALLLIAYVALQLDARNWRIMAAFALFSVTQYFVFWNLSVPDLFMYWLLGRETSENGLRRLVCADRDRGNGELGAAVGP
jgi:O-antigen ligase